MAPYDPRLDHRRSIRLRHYDYRWPGSYFVTICTEGRRLTLGQILDGEMHLNARGQVAGETWADVSRRFPTVSVDVFVMMPNHTHAIITTSSNDTVGAGFPRPSGHPQSQATLVDTAHPSLGQIVAFYKWVSTKRINERGGTPGQRTWQRHYFEHVIRNEHAYETIGEYIMNNPARWNEDALNPDLERTRQK